MLSPNLLGRGRLYEVWLYCFIFTKASDTFLYSMWVILLQLGSCDQQPQKHKGLSCSCTQHEREWKKQDRNHSIQLEKIFLGVSYNSCKIPTTAYCFSTNFLCEFCGFLKDHHRRIPLDNLFFGLIVCYVCWCWLLIICCF